jgi:integrase
VSLHDRWRGARTGPGRRWELRWRSGGQQHKRRFDSKAAAEAFDAKRRTSPEQKLAREGRTLTVSQMMATWLATKGGLRPGTIDACRVDAREVTMALGGSLASSVVPSEIRRWVARERGVSLRRRSLIALHAAYAIAISDGLLTTNPCAGIPLPKDTTKEPRYLSWAELAALAEASEEWAPLIWLLGTAGLRIGEAIGLQVGDVGETRVRVKRTVSYNSAGAQVGPPKSGKGRDVPVPGFVLAQLPAAGRTPPEWLFVGPHGGRIDVHNWRTRVFKPAAIAAGLGDLHPHSLRHTAASLAIQAGADVLAVQHMLGHSSATTTLGIYAHLWDEHLDQVAEKMSEAARESRVYLREAL